MTLKNLEYSRWPSHYNTFMVNLYNYWNLKAWIENLLQFLLMRFRNRNYTLQLLLQCIQVIKSLIFRNVKFVTWYWLVVLSLLFEILPFLFWQKKQCVQSRYPQQNNTLLCKQVHIYRSPYDIIITTAVTVIIITAAVLIIIITGHIWLISWQHRKDKSKVWFGPGCKVSESIKYH